MSAAINTFISDGYFVITVPEASVPASERDEFMSAVKAEWLARQSRMTESSAKQLAQQVDSAWWASNRERILKAIGEA